MLSESWIELLTAYVDGEVSDRQREAVTRLLQRSAEARRLLRQLQDDAQALKSLPRRELSKDFAESLLAQLPLRYPRRQREPRIPVRRALLVAASLLMMVGFGSYLFFSRPGEPPLSTGSGVAITDPLPHVPDPPVPEPNAIATSGNAPGNATVDPPTLPPMQDALAGATKTSPPEVLPETGRKPEPEPKPPEKAVLTVPVDGMEMFKPTVASVALFPLRNVRDLEATALVKDLEKASAFRIELPCRDTARAFRRLEAALRETGTGLVLDQSVVNRLSKPRLKSNYVLFVEDILPSELARSLARLGVEDRKAGEAKPKPDALFTKMDLHRMSEADHRELQDLFRADTRPVTTARPGARVGERWALAATYNPERPRPGSAEVRRFFEARRPLRPGALQVLLVLREAPG